MEAIEYGVVASVDPLDATAEVAVNAEGGCGGCTRCREAVNGARLLRALNARGAPVGARVRVRLLEANLIRSVLVVFGLPLVLCFAGLAAGWVLSGGRNALAAMGGAVGLALWVPLMRAANRRWGRTAPMAEIVSIE